jgi:2-dehydro-3-deoxyphosphooctonate aldolase (KDO 8-P synthase)
MIQQPAFLIRQTDLSVAIAKVGKACNLKKGQFQAPWDMKDVVEKFESCGNTNICLTERGISHGYGDLIVDMRSFVIMAETGYPTVIDATHSVMKPNAMGGCSGGESRLAPAIAKAALATGFVGGVFMETHPQPLDSGSDKYNQIPLMYMKDTLKQLKDIDRVAKKNTDKHYEKWNQKGKAI